MEAVSMGLRIVHEMNDLREAVEFIIDTYKQPALVERFISGREFAVGLLGNGHELETLPIVEFDMGGDPDAIQSHSDKLKQPVQKVCPPDIDKKFVEEMNRLAKESFNALGICDFSRIDLRMDTDKRLYVLELNSMASLGLTGSYVHAAKVAGLSFDALVNRMLDVAAVRYFGKASFHLADEETKMSDRSQPIRVRLRSYIRSNLTTMADYLAKMIRMNSYVYNTEGVNSVGNWISVRLKQLGFGKETFPQAEVGNILYFTNHDSRENDILLLGHLDTVYSYQDFVPFREERGRFYGSGVAESKGGLAIMLASLQALRFARRLRKVRCGILLITDDTLGGRYSKKIVQDLAAKSGLVIGLKYGGRAGGIVTSCGGRIDYSIEMTNVKNPESGEAADIITAISRKVIALQKLSNPDTGIIVHPMNLEARTLYGATPDYATMTFDTHFNAKEQGEALDKEIRKIIRKGLDSRIQIRIRKGINRPPLLESEKNKQLFEKVQKLAKLLETKVGSIHRSASSAICYVPEEVPALEGLGPAGGESRSPNEYILRDSLIDRATMLALIIRGL
jgi:D-alanine-D-alanine ligase